MPRFPQHVDVVIHVIAYEYEQDAEVDGVVVDGAEALVGWRC